MNIIIPAGERSAEYKARVWDLLGRLSDEKSWMVTIDILKAKRSKSQNAYLHAVPLRMIADETGHDVEEIKTYLLGEYGGWEEVDMFGQRRRRPVKRSSDMNIEQMAGFLNWIEAWAATELGMIIPKPNEVIT